MKEKTAAGRAEQIQRDGAALGDEAGEQRSCGVGYVQLGGCVKLLAQGRLDQRGCGRSQLMNARTIRDQAAAADPFSQGFEAQQGVAVLMPVCGAGRGEQIRGRKGRCGGVPGG